MQPEPGRADRSFGLGCATRWVRLAHRDMGLVLEPAGAATPVIHSRPGVQLVT